ncbi:unnamed protein product [Macrosiphum euphorbiae]|uniref:Uncharacterized protein n=1 Tax=Macrosiphum euphorbiae TaxID=13131 RepID=A0AAV0WKK6_9HEMI|nr:unnamed protein product [Macrosiphum euphorbiae]
MDSEKNIFESFMINEDLREYTDLQSININQSFNSIENHSVVEEESIPTESDLTNYIPTSDPNLTQNAYSFTIDDKMHLKSTLEDWKMG